MINRKYINLKINVRHVKDIITLTNQAILNIGKYSWQCDILQQ